MTYASEIDLKQPIVRFLAANRLHMNMRKREPFYKARLDLSFVP